MAEIPLDEFYDVEAVGLPAAFCIVWCWFPREEDPGEPGPVLRPGLIRHAQRAVIEVEGQKVLTGRVQVLYGTKQIDRFPPPRGFHIESEEDKRELGLIEETVFQLDNVQTLLWTKRYFGPDKSGKLINKRMNTEMQHRLKHQWLDWLAVSSKEATA